MSWSNCTSFLLLRFIIWTKKCNSNLTISSVISTVIYYFCLLYLPWARRSIATTLQLILLYMTDCGDPGRNHFKFKYKIFRNILHNVLVYLNILFIKLKSCLCLQWTLPRRVLSGLLHGVAAGLDQGNHYSKFWKSTNQSRKYILVLCKNYV